MINKQGWLHFIKLCLEAKNEKTLSSLFDVFLTPEEKESVALRCIIVEELLLQGRTQREIAQTCGVSIAKITRGSNEIKRTPQELLDFLREYFISKAVDETPTNKQD